MISRDRSFRRRIECVLRLEHAAQNDYSSEPGDAILASLITILTSGLMKSKLLALLLAVSATAAGAAPTKYEFVYQGFEWDGLWSSAKRLAGSFTGEDSNSDGTIGLSELTSFVIGGVEYVGFYENYTVNYPGIWGGVDMFSYGGGTDLKFSAGWDQSRDGDVMYSEDYYFTESYKSIRVDGLEIYRASVWNGTSDTTLTVTSAVPEPSLLGLTIAGIGIIGFAARRRNRH